MLAPFGKTLYDATRFYRDYLEKTSTSKTVAELCKLVREEFVFRLANEGTTLRHKRTMDSELKKFEARFGESLINTLSGNEIKKWLEGLKIAPKTRMKIFGYIRNAYDIAVQKGLLETHPFEKVENFLRNKKSEAPPFPLTPEEAQRLLNAAEASVLPFIAIGMFAGLRTSERDKNRGAPSYPGATRTYGLLGPVCENQRAYHSSNMQWAHSIPERLGTVGKGGWVMAVVGESVARLICQLSLPSYRLRRNNRRRRRALGTGYG